ncbi:P-loop containing nucleoside triphosphate hydrolases superfamily protein [Artemisia annua]|uniref:P-loop containing nucleoside triphosphate hydrolases superfamily protein n=1 Tax=Artemisia annua TaxID=35608 RepID=A0A2U1NGZ1_ARTAN|nr:P-loop containing nucleoside triphosphate hydrolases superfamily protein [Artemisia annua]
MVSVGHMNEMDVLKVSLLIYSSKPELRFQYVAFYLARSSVSVTDKGKNKIGCHSASDFPSPATAKQGSVSVGMESVCGTFSSISAAFSSTTVCAAAFGDGGNYSGPMMLDFSEQTVRPVSDIYVDPYTLSTNTFTDTNRPCSLIGHLRPASNRGQLLRTGANSQVLGLPAVPHLRPLNVVSSLSTDTMDIRPHGPKVLALAAVPRCRSSIRYAPVVRPQGLASPMVSSNVAARVTVTQPMDTGTVCSGLMHLRIVDWGLQTKALQTWTKTQGPTNSEVVGDKDVSGITRRGEGNEPINVCLTTGQHRPETKMLSRMFTEMPTMSSMLSAYDSLSTSMMLFRTMYDQIVPTQVQSYLIGVVKCYWKKPKASDKLTLLFEETDGRSPNDMFYAVEDFLSNKITRDSKHLK